MFYCEFLILQKKDKLIGSPAPLYKAIIFCATHKSLSVRNQAKQLIGKIGSDKGVETTVELLGEYAKFINSVNLMVGIR